MQFYFVDDDYITHLKGADEKVRENKGTRPYLGVVFEVNGIEFLAPLTSYKTKHDTIPDTFPLIFKMYELGNEKNKLGMVQLNNMVPVLSSKRTLLDLSTLDPKYRNLLNLQQQFLRKHQDELQRKAIKLYEIVLKGHAQGLIRNCCNFAALETAMKSYDQ
ncbi:type III toxin-antitoxin system ToxN/AbiQ family toxin [Shewanella baltica]|uniref:type III toxin-antitoxin system ToxN/AbiQ family toxin n=1 Tax=Shewanella baltica TaxID=62322 RepID=UPI00216A4449|nr:type III toxin-antitoxin system ToxN/AbiQ family toxin [Shewanella baltica]MCS6116912.1 type III toxin-antitoxin system ToxN/AbiQ family toxin [Shewanella baltica]UVW66504.1 type III toxin-antitoxin system ToxN/AbiQ family toxin [Shewanella baltica]